MNDISLCNGVGCPLKSKCSRFLLSKKLKSNRYAWWVDPCYKKGKCDNLITKNKIMISFKNKLIQQYLEETRNVNFGNTKKIINTGYGYQGVSYCIMSSKDDGSFDCERGNIEMLELMGWFLNKINNVKNKQDGCY